MFSRPVKQLLLVLETPAAHRVLYKSFKTGFKDKGNTIFILKKKNIDNFKFKNILNARNFTTTQITLNNDNEDGANKGIQKNITSATARFRDAVFKVMPRKKVKDEAAYHSTERNFITPVRAMNEFLLNPNHLIGLRQTKRRSPFEDEPPLVVYWRKDIENKAMEVYGSYEGIEVERTLRKNQAKQIDVFNVKRILKDYQKTKRRSRYIHMPDDDAAGRVVWTAVVINGVNLIMKLGAWAYTGSHSLFAESLHSAADVTNQLILAYGIHKSRQGPDKVHPYGYTSMRYVSSLISGAMIFCVGAGVSLQHGISGLLHPTELVPFYWAYYILGGSLLTEGGTLLMALQAIRKGASKENMSFKDYVLRGEDPSVNVVLLEDMAAVLGVGVALSCMGLTSVLGSHIPDALGSCIIGGILASVSGFIIYTNSVALVGRSIPQKDLDEMNNELEEDVMIRAIHDVKGIDMGVGFVRYKAEVDFDGRELTRNYLERLDLLLMLQEVQNMKTVEELEVFILKHGENIVDTLGAEIDRIETTLKKKHPDIRHCDLEIL